MALENPMLLWPSKIQVRFSANLRHGRDLRTRLEKLRRVARLEVMRFNLTNLS